MSNVIQIHDTNKVQCEVCNYIGPCKSYGSIIMCPVCLGKETDAKRISDSESAMRVSEIPKPKLNLGQLFIEYCEDEQFKIDALDFSTSEGDVKLQERLALLESIMYEAKARATRVTTKIRERGIKLPNGKLDRTNLSDPRNSPILKSALDKEKDKHKKALSKAEKAVQGFISLEMTDDEIIEALTGNGKFKGHEVKEAILKFRTDTQ